MRRTWRTWLARLGVALALVLVLALVFAAYLKPGFVLDLATRVYMCF